MIPAAVPKATHPQGVLATFPCAYVGARVSVRRCLERQGRAGTYCAGECEIGREVARRFPDPDAFRPAPEPQPTPTPQEETPVPNPTEKRLCNCGCGKPLRADNKTGRRADCVVRTRGRFDAPSPSDTPAQPKAAPADAPAAPLAQRLGGMTTEDLVRLRDLIGAELRDRLARADAERAALAQALGAAVG